MIVQVEVGLQPGQLLQIRSAVVSAPTARALVAAGYRAGSPLVSVLWEDPISEIHLRSRAFLVGRSSW